jgi:hypothetical protein
MENKISSWIAIGAGLVALITSIFTFNIDRKMKVLETQQKNLTYVKDSTDFTRDRDFKFKIYQLVVEAIDKKADDTLKQRAAIIVVSEMVDDKDAKFKLGLLNVIRNASRNKDIKNSTSDKIYALEETLKVKSTQSGADQWRVDVFYVEEKQKTAEPVASSVASLLKEAGYNTTVRLLPDAVNRRKGYGIKSSQIRFEPNEKDEAAKILKQVTDGAGINLDEKQTTSTTSRYISIFIFQ